MYPIYLDIGRAMATARCAARASGRPRFLVRIAVCEYTLIDDLDEAMAHAQQHSGRFTQIEPNGEAHSYSVRAPRRYLVPA